MQVYVVEDEMINTSLSISSCSKIGSSFPHSEEMPCSVLGWDPYVIALIVSLESGRYELMRKINKLRK